MELSIKYILQDKTPVRCEDLMEWARWLETADLTVKIDALEGVRVSTVFLGMDHRYIGDGPPILFETMIFGAAAPELGLDDYQERYSDWEQAELGHMVAVTLARRKLGISQESLASDSPQAETES